MNDITVEKMVSTRIPTRQGEFKLCLYRNNADDKEHLALIMGKVTGKSNVLVRVHSECFTGDVIGSLRCDCGEQLKRALSMIARQGEGVLVYLRQEGRGIGLLDKLRAYNLQDLGYDTVEANLLLGHQPDERDYTIAARILQDLRVHSVRLLTNNPTKIEKLSESGVPIVERVALQPTLTADNADYLYTKVRRMHHLFDLHSAQVDRRTSQHGSD